MKWNSQADLELASLETHELTALLSGRIGLRKVQDADTCEPMMALIADLAADPEWKERREFIARFLRLPGSLQALCFEFLMGNGPYSSMRPALILKLRNVSNSPVDLIVGLRHRPYGHSAGNAVTVSGGLFETEPTMRTVQPGEMVEVTPEFAVHNLMKYDRSSRPPSQWLGSWPFPDAQGEAVQEVGYSATFQSPATGELIAAESDDYRGDPQPFTSEQLAEKRDAGVAVAKSKARKAKK